MDNLVRLATNAEGARVISPASPPVYTWSGRVWSSDEHSPLSKPYTAQRAMLYQDEHPAPLCAYPRVDMSRRLPGKAWEGITFSVPVKCDKCGGEH